LGLGFCIRDSFAYNKDNNFSFIYGMYMWTRWSIKRFLEPVIVNRRQALHLSAYELTVSMVGVGVVYTTQIIVSALEDGNMEVFQRRIFLLLWVTFFGYVIKVFRKPYIFSVFSDIQTTLDKLYLVKIIHRVNNMYEKIVTGKLMWIYVKDIKSRELVITQIFWDFAWSVWFFVVFLFTIYQQEVFLFWGSVWVL
jgi:hypothetical protein